MNLKVELICVYDYFGFQFAQNYVGFMPIKRDESARMDRYPPR